MQRAWRAIIHVYNKRVLAERLDCVAWGCLELPFRGNERDWIGRVGPILRDRVTAPPAALVSVSPHFPFPFPFPFCLRLMGRHTHSMLLLSLLTLNAARAHEHDEELTEGAAHAAVDSILWIHIFLQAAVWGILFPIGMVFGISRSRWHVPLQVCLRPRLLPSFRFSTLLPLSHLLSPYHDFTLANPLRHLSLL
jgi:hypothetical protein